jgi:KUP system potassium uptake protein
VARGQWRTARWKLAMLGALFLTVEIAFFSANLAKIAHGAWLSLGVGLAISFFMVTWRRGREILTRNRSRQEGSLAEFLDGLRTAEPPVRRVPGTAIFLNPGKETTPLALRAEVVHNHILHESVLIVSVESVGVPRVDDADRFVTEWLGRGLFKVLHVSIHTGYRDRADIPGALAVARKQGLLARNLDLEHASYFISRMTITPSDAPGMKRWRKALFIVMARNATSPITHFGLPSDRTVIMGSQVAL